MNHRRLTFGFVGATLSLMLMCADFAAGKPSFLLPSAAANWTEEDLGTQIREVLATRAVFGKGDRMALALMGNPGEVVIVDTATHREIERTREHGFLYGLNESTSKPVALMKTAPGKDAFFYGLVPAGDGLYYGGVYPGCLVYRFNSRTNRMTSLGPAVAGEDYARSLAFDPKTNTLYVGVGSHAALIAWNMTTGEKKNILPEAYRSEQFIDRLDLRSGRLYAHCLPSGRVFVLDPATGKTTGEIHGVSGTGFSEPSPIDEALYFSSSGKLCRLDPASGKRRELPGHFNAWAVGFHWTSEGKGKSPILEAALSDGTLLRYDPIHNTSKMYNLGIKGCAIRIHNIFRAPNGKIVSSAYILRRLVAFDPATGKSESLAHVKQTEGYATYGSHIYMGCYPHADIYTLDMAKPIEDGNPRVLVSLDRYGQDRPFALLPSPDGKQLYIGTLPTYGELGGALSVLDLDTNQLTVHRNVVADQAVVTLAWHDGLVYGGTTIYGGLGIKPKAKEARLFIWDPKKNQTVFETVPVPGKKGLSGLNFGPDGVLWGWAQGTLFAFNPTTRKVVYSKEEFTSAVQPRHYWRGGGATVVHDGKLYGTIDGNVYVLDMATRKLEVLARGKNLEVMARDDEGRLYFTNDAHLCRLVPRKRTD